MSLTPSLGLPYGVVAAFMGHSWNDVAWVIAIVVSVGVWVWIVGSASIDWVRDSRARRAAAVDVDADYFDALAVNSQVDERKCPGLYGSVASRDFHPAGSCDACDPFEDPPYAEPHSPDWDAAIARTLAEFDAARRKEDTP